MQFDDLRDRTAGPAVSTIAGASVWHGRGNKKVYAHRTLKASNVASQPKYSPLRYPGGKTWLIPQIRVWLSQQPTQLLVEPFAGGATASLVAILEGYANHSVIVERDPSVAALWKTILSKDAEWLANKLLSFRCNLENVRRVLKGYPQTSRSLAFQTIVKNRVCRGGILNDSAKLMKKGERGRGIRSRWYPDTLALRIALIYSYRHQFTFIQGDGFKTIADLAKSKESVRFFVDPPYPVDGCPHRKRLYAYNHLNHQKLFTVLAGISQDFLMTNDDSLFIRSLANQAKFIFTRIRMWNTHGLPRHELLIRPPRTSRGALPS